MRRGRGTRHRIASRPAPRPVSMRSRHSSCCRKRKTTTAAARGELQAARAELNALLAYPPEAAPALSEVLEAGRLPTLQAAHSRQALGEQRGAAGSATVSSTRRAHVSRSPARCAAPTRASRQPSPTMRSRNSQSDGASAATVALPIFTTGRADVAVAEATLARVAANATRAPRRSPARWPRPSRARPRRARRSRGTRPTILPASLQVEAMAEESYRSGQTGLAGAAADAAGRARDPPARAPGGTRLSAGARRSRARDGNAPAMTWRHRPGLAFARRRAGGAAPVVRRTKHRSKRSRPAAAAPVTTVIVPPRHG